MKHVTITIASQQYLADEPTQAAYKSYTQQLKKTVDDDGQLLDIEARIVELLGEMNIRPNDTVKLAHFKKVFMKLGGPQSFEDKPIVDIAHHQRVAIMRTLGVSLVALAIIVAVFTITSILARDGNDDFPAGVGEWLYAAAGLLTVGSFIAGCIAVGWGLMKTKFTAVNKRAIKLLTQGFAGSFVLTFVAALLIALTN